MSTQRLLIFIIALALPFSKSEAGVRDTTRTSTLEYKEELGYFQKANRDLSDPIFMLYDPEAGLDFGIGGSMRMMASFDGIGSLRSVKFNPALIDVPTDNSSTFNSSIAGSEIHVKARYHFDKHKVIAFLRFSSSYTNTAVVSSAYLSLDGLSFGLIPSFFMDLEVGYLAAGSSVLSPVNCARTLLGYKQQIGKHWIVGTSLENPDLALPSWLASTYGLAADNQGVPDITLHAKYRWDTGHIQVGTVLRNIKYWSYIPPVQYSAQGLTIYELGYGLSLTGNQRLGNKLTLSGEFVYGKGISRYLELFNNNVSDLGVCTAIGDDGMYRMKALPVFHGVVAAQMDWNKKFTSTVLLSYAKSYDIDGVMAPSFERTDFSCGFERSLSANANLFWHISSNAYAGIEAIVGQSHLRNTILPDADQGTLARLMMACTFMF